MPDKRSVYFSSLAGRAGYEKIYNQGMNVIGSVQLAVDLKQNEQAIDKFMVALSVLEKGIAAERAIEQQYITNLLSSFNKLPSAAASILQNDFSNLINSDGSFDYIKFINLINSLLIGVDNYRHTLELEQERGKQLTAAMQRLKDEQLEEQKQKNKGKDESQIEKILNEELRNIYLQRHSFRNSSYTQYFSDITPTIDYLAAQYVNNVVKQIFNSKELMAEITNQVTTMQGSNQSLETFILNNVLKDINTQVPKITKAALQSSAQNIDDLYSEMENKAFQLVVIQGEKDNFGVRKHRTKNVNYNFDEEGKVQTNISGTKLADLLVEIYDQLDRNNHEDLLVNILNEKWHRHGTKKAQDQTIFQLLDQLADEQKKLEELKKSKKQKVSDDRTIQEIKHAIYVLKQNISKQVRQRIDKQLNKVVEDEVKISVINKLKETLTPGAVKITGPEFSEIIDTFIQNNFRGNTSFFAGPRNLKADTVTIQYAPREINAKINTGKISSIIDNAIEDNVSTFYNTFQNALPKSGEATSFERGATTWVDAVKTYRGKIEAKVRKDTNAGEDDIQILEEIAKKLQETIVVTETIKTFNQYQNDLGFIGGSLGPNIITQLNNFTELFSKAGVDITTQEFEWLEVAIVNCASAALGAHNREPIERYLSTMAGFAIFDEGGAEIDALVRDAESIYGGASPQLMHLYKLNGLYFPGSYILERIYENLKQNLTNAAAELTNVNNDGAKIRATASERLIGHNIKTDREKGGSGSFSGAERWRQVYSAAQSSSITSIEVSFLSGLFNIVNQLYSNLLI